MANETRKTELLSPAGGPSAGHAALDAGADAIYLGLQKFSARSDAENFIPDELSEIVSYAHSLSPKRKVYVTLNTIVYENELDDVIDTLAMLSDMEVDGLIVQDLGLAVVDGSLRGGLAGGQGVRPDDLTGLAVEDID